MSITLHCEFSDRQSARGAADRLRRRGFAIREPETPPPMVLTAPYGLAGGNRDGNALMGALPPLAGAGLFSGPRNRLNVLTDDTQTAEARRLVEALGGRVLN